jgi:hypothetical protein
MSFASQKNIMPRVNSVARVVRRGVSCAAFVLALVAAAASQVSVTTYHNDNARTGENTKETILTPLNVNSTLFGKLFSQTVDSYVYAQPLYLPSVTIPHKGVHNVVYVATQHDSVYAFDADSNTGTASLPLWHVSFIDPAAGIRTLGSKDTQCGDIPPEVGILSTPVIDSATGTLYVLARTVESGVYFQRLHALDVATGTERLGSPVIIQASVPGTGSASSGGQIAFDPLMENQRTGLLLQGNSVYIAWGSQCDNPPYHGWLMSYDAATLQQRGVWISTPNGSDGAIWQSGAAPATDSEGNVYFTTGNGTFDVNTGGVDYGDSVVKVTPASNGSLAVADYFTPYNQSNLNAHDKDLGSGGPVVLPFAGANAPYPDLLVQIGKQGTLYVVNRDNMGHFLSTGNTQVVQSIPNAVLGQGAWTTGAWWNTNLYLSGAGDYVRSYLFHATAGLFARTSSSQSPGIFNYPGSIPSVSANGSEDGIVWTLEEDAFASKGPAILHAYDATNLANELYNSNQNSARDDPGGAVKFAVPTIANGKVYVGAEMQLSVYGLLPAASASISPPRDLITQETTSSSVTSTPTTLAREH